jgi:hypothetical protein
MFNRWDEHMAEIPNTFAQGTFVFKCAGITDPMVTTIGMFPPPSDSANDIADALATAWTASGAPFQGLQFATGYTLEKVDVTRGTPTGPVIGTKSVGLAGGGGPAGVSANNAVICRKQTGRGGRKGRGRMYLPGGFLQETDVDLAGIITSSVVTSMNGKLATALSNMRTADLTPMLLHTLDTDAPDEITSMSVVPLVGTQRRRIR